MPDDNATCPMFSSNIGWPHTAIHHTVSDGYATMGEGEQMFYFHNQLVHMFVTIFNI